MHVHPSQISDAVLRGHIKVLYVSPERLCTPSFRRLISLLKQQRAFQHASGIISVVFSLRASARVVTVKLSCVPTNHVLTLLPSYSVNVFYF